MDDAKTLLRSYLEALSEPTRASILLELSAAGELTATQIARRLELSVNNVYHHIRALNRLGVLAEPRIVPGPSYVEKYYKVRDIMGMSDPLWHDNASEGLSPAEQQMHWAAFCAHLGQIFMRAAKRYAALTPEEWERAVFARQTGMLSLRLLDDEHYLEDLNKVRQITSAPNPSDGETQNVMVIAALPELMRLPAEGTLRGAQEASKRSKAQVPRNVRKP